MKFNRTPDYYTITISEGIGVVGASQTVTVDYKGNVYGGVGMGAGKSWIISGNVSVGWLENDERPVDKDLNRFLEGHGDNE